jgi:hypothetical protein
MPKREDERLLNLAGRHPAACTCRDCTDRFLKANKIKPQRNWSGKNKSVAEKIAKHPVDCGCASCVLLGSLENLPQLDRGPKGFFKRSIGKR